jgi:4-hydroxybenzoate polyprenyltransferase
VIQYLRLLRLPNVFTAIADIGLGFALTWRLVVQKPDQLPWGLLAGLAAASSFLYLAGMVFNDVFDVEVDRKERPNRPIPSGAIPLATARLLAVVLLLLGCGLAWFTGWAFAEQMAHWWKPGAVGCCLAAAILSYDGWAKQTILGPWNMGLCRFLNVLLGAAAGPAIENSVVLGYSPGMLLVAAGIGLYIVGVTIFAKKEAEESRAGMLGLGLVVMIAGIGVVGLLPLVEKSLLRTSSMYFAVLLTLLGISIVRRCVAAIQDSNPKLVQTAVKQAILSVIMFDAAICLFVMPPWYSMGVVALLLPAMLLGRWIYST